MDKTKAAKELALHALSTMEAKVDAIGTQCEENFAVFRNIQKTIEALMQTVLNDGTTEDSYMSSDFGWKAGEWPLKAQLQTGEHITRTNKEDRSPEGELRSVFYRGEYDREIEIFND